MEAINNFLKIGSGDGDGDGDGYGDGSGSGSGYGSGYGFSDGSGYGSGSGFGDGYGYGDGSGDGYGDGYGYGSGSGDGDGDGDGSGSGSGSGDGLINYLNNKVYYVDCVATLIDSVKGNVAKCRIVNDDLTTTDSYLVKVGNYFAHGESIRKAMRDAENKHFNNLNVDDKIVAFKQEFSDVNAKIPATQLFEWHYRLTGSCEQGRKSFCFNKGIDINTDAFTIDEFKTLVKGHYGSDVIDKL